MRKCSKSELSKRHYNSDFKRLTKNITSWNNCCCVSKEGGKNVHEGKGSDGPSKHCQTWILHCPRKKELMINYFQRKFFHSLFILESKD